MKNIEMKNASCTGPGCGGRPQVTRRAAAGGAPLCTGCDRELRASLIELPKIYRACEAALLPRRNSGLQRVSGTRHEPGILLDQDAVDARADILSFLASWSALVADERAVTKPIRRDPAELVRFLVTHLDWLLAHPAGGDFADEIRQLTARARRSIYLQPALRRDLGQCVHSGCTAAISPAPPTRDGRRSREVSCAAGHVWQPHQWLALFRQIQQTRHRLDDAAGAHQVGSAG